MKGVAHNNNYSNSHNNFIYRKPECLMKGVAHNNNYSNSHNNLIYRKPECLMKGVAHTVRVLPSKAANRVSCFRFQWRSTCHYLDNHTLCVVLVIFTPTL